MANNRSTAMNNQDIENIVADDSYHKKTQSILKN